MVTVFPFSPFWEKGNTVTVYFGAGDTVLQPLRPTPSSILLSDQHFPRFFSPHLHSSFIITFFALQFRFPFCVAIYQSSQHPFHHCISSLRFRSRYNWKLKAFHLLLTKIRTFGWPALIGTQVSLSLLRSFAELFLGYPFHVDFIRTSRRLKRV